MAEGPVDDAALLFAGDRPLVPDLRQPPAHRPEVDVPEATHFKRPPAPGVVEVQVPPGDPGERVLVPLRVLGVEVEDAVAVEQGGGRGVHPHPLPVARVVVHPEVRVVVDRLEQAHRAVGVEGHAAGVDLDGEGGAVLLVVREDLPLPHLAGLGEGRVHLLHRAREVVDEVPHLGAAEAVHDDGVADLVRDLPGGDREALRVLHGRLLHEDRVGVAQPAAAAGDVRRDHPDEAVEALRDRELVDQTGPEVRGQGEDVQAVLLEELDAVLRVAAVGQRLLGVEHAPQSQSSIPSGAAGLHAAMTSSIATPAPTCWPGKNVTGLVWLPAHRGKAGLNLGFGSPFGAAIVVTARGCV